MRYKNVHIKLVVHSTRCTHAYSAFITQFYMYLQAYNTRERGIRLVKGCLIITRTKLYKLYTMLSSLTHQLNSQASNKEISKVTDSSTDCCVFAAGAVYVCSLRRDICILRILTNPPPNCKLQNRRMLLKSPAHCRLEQAE